MQKSQGGLPLCSSTWTLAMLGLFGGGSPIGCDILLNGICAPLRPKRPKRRQMMCIIRGPSKWFTRSQIQSPILTPTGSFGQVV